MRRPVRHRAKLLTDFSSFTASSAYSQGALSRLTIITTAKLDAGAYGHIGGISSLTVDSALCPFAEAQNLVQKVRYAPAIRI